MGSLMLNGINYSGGGSDIEPNPTGEPTATLNKLGIEGAIYGIAGSGGGGTVLILDAQIYSTEERVVGVWFDNKPLYSRVFDLGSDVQVSYDSFTDTSIDASDLEKVVDAKGFYSTGATAYNVMGNINNNIIRLQTDRNGVVANIRYVLLFYTKTTDTAGSGGYQAYGFSPIIYSTEEREVGVWIDGKPLYQKTISYNFMSVTSDWTLFDDSVSYETLIDARAVRQLNDGYQSYSNTLNAVPRWYVKNSDHKMYYFTTSSNIIGKVTFLYTKTTDIAGSGSFNTLGVPMVHESTTEQVIGTDENGNTKYEITLATPTSQSGNSYFFDLTGVDDVEIVGGYIDIGTADIPLNFNIGSFNNSTYTFYDKQNSRVISYIVGWTPSYFKIKIQYTKSSS